jgi:hypothetical protein
MTRARILLVKPVLPYPPDQGTKVVSMGLIDALSPAHDVTVLARLLGPDEEAHVRALEKRVARVVTVLPRNRVSPLARGAYKLGYAARSLATGRSLKSLYDCPGATIAQAQVLARERFDLVIVEYWQMYPLLDVFERERTVSSAPLPTPTHSVRAHRSSTTPRRASARAPRGGWKQGKRSGPTSGLPGCGRSHGKTPTPSRR